MFISHVSGKSLGWPPRVGSWFLAGKNSRASHKKVKGGLFRQETHCRDRVCAILKGRRGGRVWGFQFL